MKVTVLKYVLWAFLFCCKLFTVPGSLATQSLWKGTTNSWGTGTNWSNGAPTGIAEFGNVGLTGILLSQNTKIAQIVFDGNASAYTINTNGKTLTLTTGVTNNSDQLQIITNSTPTKSTLTFQNGTIAGGNIAINNVTSGSTIAFTGNSSANNATITNAAGCTVDMSGLAGLTPTITVGSLSGAGAVKLGSSTLITGGLGLNDIISGVISGGGGSVTKTGTGTLTLSGTNTYTGSTTINAGTLQMGKDNVLSTKTAVTVDGGATFNLADSAQHIGSLAGSGGVDLGSGVLATGNDNTDTVYAGILSGTGELSKVGKGTFTLLGANTYTGTTTINAGTLQAGVTNALAQTTPVTVVAGATFGLNNYNQMIGSLAGAGKAELGSATLSTGYANTNTAFSGVLSGSGGLTKVGTGTLILSGTNTHTGTTTISAGALQMGKANKLAMETAVTVSKEATFNLANFSQSVGSLAGSGNVTLGSGTLTTGNDNTDTTFSGVMSGTGGVTKVGTGTFCLSENNTYTGATNISAGTLQMGKANSLAAGSVVTVSAAGTFDLGNSNQTIASLTGAGSVILGNGFLTTGNNTNTTFSGIMSGTGGFTKIGTGIFTLSGTNAYAGPTNISAGTLKMGKENSLATGTVVTVDVGTTFNLANFSQSIGSLAGSGNVTLGSGTLTTGNDNTDAIYSGILSGTDGLTKVGTGVLTLSGTNTYTGSTTINAGTLQMGKDNVLSTKTAVTVDGGATFNLADSAQHIGSLAGSGGVDLGSGALATGNDNTDTVYAGILSGTGDLTKAGKGSMTLSGINTYTGATTINAGTLQAGAKNALAQTTPVTVVAGAMFGLNNYNQMIGSLAGAGKAELGSATLSTGYANTNTAFSGVLSGSGGLTKVGTGTLILSGTNTYTGTTTISAGALQMGKANKLAMETAVTVAKEATFNLANFSQSVGSLAGSGNVSLGSGTLTTGNDNTDTTFSGVMSGTGGFTKTGTGIFTLLGANTYSGGTTINAGILQGNSSSLKGLLNIGQFGQLTFNQNLTDGVFEGVLSGAGTLEKQGSKTLTLTGLMPFMGPINIQAGTLLMNYAPQFVHHGNAKTLTIQSGGTLMGAGPIQQTVVNNGLLSVGNPMETGLETLTLMNGYQGNGALTFKLDNEGKCSKLVSASGNIDLRQTSLHFESSDSIKALQTYDLIQVQKVHTDVISGPFQSIPNRVGKFVPSITYATDSVQLLLRVEPTSFAPDSKSGNDQNIAKYIDQLSSAAQGSLEKFIFQLEDLTTHQRDDVFNQLGPATQASMAKSLGIGSLVAAMTQARMRNLASGGQGMIASSVPGAFTSIGNSNLSSFSSFLTADKNREPAYHSTRAALIEDNAYHLPLGNGKGSIWVQGFAIRNQQKTTQGIIGFGARSGGLMTGADVQIPTTNFHVGAAVGYGRGKVSFKQARGSSKINSRLASIYSIYAPKDFYIDAALGCGLNKYQNNRQLPSLGKTAESLHRGTELTPHLGAGVNFKFQEIFLQPFVNVDYLYLREGGYTEQNADFANLTVLSNASSQWRGEAGLNISKTFSFANGNWTLLGKVSYIRKQPHKSDKHTSMLVGQTTTFETEALSLKQNEISPGIGLKLDLKNGFFIAARYDAELSVVSTVQEVGIKLGYIF